MTLYCAIRAVLNSSRSCCCSSSSAHCHYCIVQCTTVLTHCSHDRKWPHELAASAAVKQNPSWSCSALLLHTEQCLHQPQIDLPIFPLARASLSCSQSALGTSGNSTLQPLLEMNTPPSFIRLVNVLALQNHCCVVTTRGLIIHWSIAKRWVYLLENLCASYSVLLQYRCSFCICLFWFSLSITASHAILCFSRHSNRVTKHRR